MYPSPSNKMEIFLNMDETRCNRFESISAKETVGNILEKYPRLLDYNGELVRIIY